MKYKFLIIILVFSFVAISSVSAVTKPEPDADLDALSYIFYLYYDNGQLFGDRNYEVKYDIISEKYIASLSPETAPYFGEVVNFKYEIVAKFGFDPKSGLAGNIGKVNIKAPYAPNGLRVNFFERQTGVQLVTIFVNLGSLCNENGVCNEAGGENEKTCLTDCKQTRPRVSPVTAVVPTIDESQDFTMILIYAVGGVGVAVGAWFGWKWWKKKKEGDFPMSPPESPASSSPFGLPSSYPPAPPSSSSAPPITPPSGFPPLK